MTAWMSHTPSWLSRAVRAVRLWFEWGDVTSVRPSPAHGWLLPPLSHSAVQRVPVTAPPGRPGRTLPTARAGE
jgi:hypothetical protein